MKEPIRFVTIWFNDGDANLYTNVERFAVYQFFFLIRQNRLGTLWESWVPVDRIAKFRVG